MRGGLCRQILHFPHDLAISALSAPPEVTLACSSEAKPDGTSRGIVFANSKSLLVDGIEFFGCARYRQTYTHLKQDSPRASDMYSERAC